MRSTISMALAACAVVAISSQALAQAPAPTTPPAPPSAGGTPDGIPFDIPYGTSIGLEKAKQLMAAAEAEAKKHNWKMNIAVVDTNGEWSCSSGWKARRSRPVRFRSARPAPRRASAAKAGVFYNAYETGHTYPGTLDPTLVASPGGFPLVEGGKLIGAIGCSGGTGDQDAATCKAGADLMK